MPSPLRLILNIVRGVLVLPLFGLVFDSIDKMSGTADNRFTSLTDAVLAVGVVALSIALSPTLWAARSEPRPVAPPPTAPAPPPQPYQPPGYPRP